jgi:RNA polymerase sigma factor (TIGR02999 family)
LSDSGFGRLLDRATEGDPRALKTLIPLVYDELRRLARAQLRRERPGHTLQTTALVHEAYLRLAGQEKLSFESRGHLRAIAANTMRRILVEHARARRAAKRGGERARLTLTDGLGLAEESKPVDVLALDEALRRLAEVDPRASRVVELRFFGGLTVEETAEILGVSAPTIKREWALARAWLRREMSLRRRGSRT